MKAFTLVDNTKPEKACASLYRYQAQERKHHQFDLRIEMELVGARLRRLRLDNGYTLETAAEALKMRKYTLSRIEHGLYVHLGLTEFYKLAELYGELPLDILSVIPDANFENLDF